MGLARSFERPSCPLLGLQMGLCKGMGVREQRGGRGEGEGGGEEGSVGEFPGRGGLGGLQKARTICPSLC